MAILLGVIKWIFIIIACVCLLMLIIVALVLFPAVRYEILAEKSEKTIVLVKASFLFKTLRLRYDENGFSIKFLWVALGKKKEEAYEQTEEAPENSESAISEENPKEESSKEEKTKAKKTKDKKTKEEKGEKQDILSSVKEKIDEAKKYILHPSRDEIIKHTLQLLADILRALKPKEMSISGEIGFEDPSLTGMVIGAIAVVRGLSRQRINVTGSFEEEKMNIHFFAKGKTSLWAFVLPLLKWIFKKPVWAVIKPLLFKKRPRSIKKDI